MFDNFAKYAVDNGGKIKPLIVPSEQMWWKGAGLMNPSVCKHNGNIIVNIRHTNYILYKSEKNIHEHIWGPLVYLHKENDRCLATKNYIAILDDDLNIVEQQIIDTSDNDKEPLWDFHGLEDIRLVNWNGKLFGTGVRRDTNTVGAGRMDLSHIGHEDGKVKELERIRVPATEQTDKTTYCEKNWMPIEDRPYEYMKWSNPVEIVKYDPETHTTHQLYHGKFDSSCAHDERGGSQVIPFKDGYLGLQHVTYFIKNTSRKKDGDYVHRFTYWDKEWNVIKRSQLFAFLAGAIEFSCGMCKHNDNYLITFGFQDNAAFILEVTSDALEKFIYD